MVPMIPSPPSSLKRSPPTDFELTPPAKRQDRRTRHHALRYSQLPHKDTVSIPQDDTIIQTLLSRSISLALDAVGFKGAEPVAAESFRAQTEEYMLHFLSSIRQSMLSCRRRQPIPQDFTYALSQHKLTISSLIPHLQPPISPLLSQVWLDPANEAAPPPPDVLPFLGPALSGAPDKERRPYIPSHFPPFPSKHTYKATPEFTERENDPRAVRERATEEGRLGEEALRRLIGAGKAGDSRHKSLRGKGAGGPRQKLEDKWLQTMQAVSEEEELRENGLEIDAGHQAGELSSKRHGPRNALEKLELGALVNWEKRYWRVDAEGHEPRSQRKPDLANKDDVLMKDGLMATAP